MNDLWPYAVMQWVMTTAWQHGMCVMTLGQAEHDCVVLLHLSRSRWSPAIVWTVLDLRHVIRNYNYQLRPRSITEYKPRSALTYEYWDYSSMIQIQIIPCIANANQNTLTWSLLLFLLHCGHQPRTPANQGEVRRSVVCVHHWVILTVCLLGATFITKSYKTQFTSLHV